MKTIKVLYNEATSFILNHVNKFEKQAYIEVLNADIYKDRGKVRVLQEDYGTKTFPLVVFEDENLVGVAAIWPESNPDWEKEIIRILKEE